MIHPPNFRVGLMSYFDDWPARLLISGNTAHGCGWKIARTDRPGLRLRHRAEEVAGHAAAGGGISRRLGGCDFAAGSLEARGAADLAMGHQAGLRAEDDGRAQHQPADPDG